MPSPTTGSKVNRMSQYTILEEKEVAEIIDQYDIGAVRSYKLLTGGSENTNYLLTTNDGKYVLSICEQKSKAQAKELADLLTHLEVNGFNSSKVVLSKKKEPIIMWQNKPLMIKEFIEGDIIKELSSDLLKMIGAELAKVHKVELPAYIPKQLNYGIEQFAKVKEYAPQSEFDQWLGMIESYVSPYLKLGLPQALVHSDLFWDNVIVKKDQSSVTIMDFEEAAYYYRVFDMGMTIIGTCAEDNIINLEKAKQLLTGYQSEGNLSLEEQSSLKAFTIYAGASMTYWRHQNFNYVKPDPAMFDHYKGLQVLVDFMLQQDDDCFVL